MREVTQSFVEVDVDGDRLFEALEGLGVKVPESVRTLRISTGRGFVQFAEHDVLRISWRKPEGEGQ